MPNYPYTFQLPPLNLQDIPSNGAVGEFLGISAGGVLDWLPVSASGGGDMLKADNLSGLADYAIARTNIGLGTASTPTFANLTLTSPSLSSSAPVTISQTWNNAAVAFTGLKFNAAGTSDVNSASGSLLLDLQVAGVSKFNVDKTGLLNIANGSFLLRSNVSGANEFRFLNNGLVFRNVAESPVLKISSVGLWLSTDRFIGFGSVLGTTPETVLAQDAANTLALRNGAAAQTFNVYGTSSASNANYARLALTCGLDGNATISTQALGTGTAGAVSINGIAASSTGTSLTFAGANGIILSQSNYINLQSNAYAAVQALGARGVGNEPSSIACIYGPPSGVIDATSAFKIYRRTSGVDSVPFMVNNAGNVGIGTTSPTSKLHVAGNASPSITVDNTLATGASQLLFKNTVVTGDTDGIFLNGSTQTGFGGAGSLNIKATTGPIAFHTASVTNALSIAQNGITTLASGLAVGATHASSLADFIASGSLVLGSTVPQVILNSTTSAQESRFASGGDGFFFDVAGHATASFNNAIFRTGQTNASYNLTEVFRITYNGLITFGGLANTVPAIKRSTVRLQARLADDSAFTNIQGKLTTDTDYTAGSISPTGFLTLYDAQGNAYKVPCVAA